jgi:hypothetical protein
MNAHVNATNPAETGATIGPQRDLDLPALVAISWSVAGGLLAGGATVATLILTSHLSGHLLIAASAAFFAIGAALGLAHGTMLGVFGRPEGTTPRQALGSIGRGAIFLLPALLLGWLIAGWVAALPIVLIGHHILGGVITLGAWMIMAAVVAVASASGLRAARLLFRRWPDRILGSVLVAAVLVALSVMFAIERPTVWFVNVQLSTFGSLAFVYALTFWFYGPLITGGLALLRRIAPMLPAGRLVAASTWRARLSSAAAVIAVALLVVTLALPFHEGVLGLPTAAERLGWWQAALLALGNAVTTELLLRLCLFTAVFVLASRYLTKTRAVGVALAVSAVGDLLIHWNGIAAYGMPGAGVVATYMVARLAIPAILFGYLFWRRGLGTAMAAHATADLAIGLLVI